MSDVPFTFVFDARQIAILMGGLVHSKRFIKANMSSLSPDLHAKAIKYIAECDEMLEAMTIQATERELGILKTIDGGNRL